MNITTNTITIVHIELTEAEALERWNTRKEMPPCAPQE